MLQKTGFAAVAAADAYRRDIDGLRALAVAAVVAFHAFPMWLPGGFVGVDIFFVISGYLISGHILQNLESGRFSILDFYSRRVRRIFPALIFVMACSFGFGWIALMSDEFMQLGKHVASGAAFIANLTFWMESGYFDNSAATKPMLHLWSLGVEEQFYIVWPVAAWIAWRLRISIIGTILAIALVSMVINLGTVQSNAVAAFYSPLSRFWELLIGAGLAQIERKREPLARTSANICSVLGAFLTAASLWHIREDQAFPGLIAAIPTAGAALIIAAGPSAFLNRFAFGNQIAVAIGLISYPLYLWHWPLLSFAHIIESGLPARNVRITLVLAAIALAGMTYFLIERPIRFGRWKKANLVAALSAAMILVGSSGLWAYWQGGLPNRAAVQDKLRISSQFVGPLWAYTKNDSCLRRYPFPEAEEYGWWFCMLGRDEPPSILLLGSSFANQLYPGITFNDRLKHHNVLSIGTCDAVEVDAGSINGQTTTNPCSGPRWANQQRLIDGILEQEKSIEAVIIDGLLPGGDDDYNTRVARRVATAAKHAAEVIVFTPHIRSDVDIKGCFARPFKEPMFSCEIPTTDYQNWTRFYGPLFDKIREMVPTAKFFDQNQAFCHDGKCSLVVEGMPLIRDEYHHISEFGSRVVGSVFVKWAETNFPTLLSDH